MYDWMSSIRLRLAELSDTHLDEKESQTQRHRQRQKKGDKGIDRVRQSSEQCRRESQKNTCVRVCVCVYTHTYREKERERERKKARKREKKSERMNLSCSGSGGRKRLALDTSLHTDSPHVKT